MSTTPTSMNALNALMGFSGPTNVIGLMQCMPGNPPRSTVSRALRRMRAKGIVSSKRNGGRWVLWSFKQIQPAKVRVNKQQAKGPVGSNNMCTPTNMPTLYHAVETQVALFIHDEKEFSAFDVTKALRDKVEAASISKTDSGIDDGETGTVYVSGNSVAKIDHAVVKEAVHNIFHLGEMLGYDRAFSGSHWLYSKEKADDTVAPVTIDTPSSPTDPQNDLPSVGGTDYDGTSSL